MMLDNEFYGLVNLAYELRVSFSDLMDMPMHEAQVWLAFFARRHAEQNRK